MMLYPKRAALAVVGAMCTFSLAAAEEAKSNSVMVISPRGQMSSMPMPDKEKTDILMKHAIPMSDDMAILVWGSKTYMIKNEKMPDGKMTFDVWGIHFDK